MSKDWKYPKIENYKEGMSDELYLVQEKIDGCNIQIEFTPNGKRVVYSRTCELNTQEKRNNLFGLGTFILENPDMQKLMHFFELKAMTDGKYYRIAGEFFGNSIQKRINYNQNMGGHEKCFKIFDIFIEGHKLPPVAFLKVVEAWQLTNYIAPYQMLQASSMDDAVKKWSTAYAVEKILSKYSNEHFVEGVVFKSSNQMAKYKRESFGEITIKTTKQKKELDISENRDILDLVNDNRVLSAQSKLGEFKPQNFSEWMNLIVQDCLDDYKNEIENEKDVKKALRQEVSNTIKKMYM